MRYILDSTRADGEILNNIGGYATYFDEVNAFDLILNILTIFLITIASVYLLISIYILSKKTIKNKKQIKSESKLKILESRQRFMSDTLK